MCRFVRHASERGLWVAILVAGVAILGPAGCQPLDEGGDTMPTRDINEVMEAHVDSLMALPGVTGVAIGQTDDGTPCILVLVIEDTDDVRAKIPGSLEGHPVKIFESGEIKPFDSE